VVDDPLVANWLQEAADDDKNNINRTIALDGGRDFKLGDRVELYPWNLDMSTNVYDRYYVARGEQIVDVLPMMGRAGAAQR
jgi:D-serine deaminase-like pyridoxal phosphate-dependent protein